ncbi:MAG: HEAT repeat domain-containing protein [Candidatus Bipolaricaulota bacterium]|nr:HEAT repeat domain-containing protein [Candidatus Bipolaricaulota bacterium]MDW8140725.1 HEAT repeat domain-containing protein [Candidatus Bipolaricaulota bacterium]
MRVRWALGALLLSVAAMGQEAPSLDRLVELKREALAVFSQILTEGIAAERLSAVNSLVRNGDDSVVLLLAERLLNDEASFVRRGAAVGLGRFRSQEAQRALRRAALSDEIASIRWDAALSLKDSDVILALLSQRETLAAAALSLQESAARLPGAIWPSVEVALLRAFPDGESFNVVERAAMLKALAQLGSLGAVDRLRATLADSQEDPFVRGAAAFALGVLGVRNAVPELISALRTESDSIQVGAATALGYLREPSAVEPLIALLQTGRSPQARVAAAEALGAFGSRAASALAQALLTDPGPTVRQAALRGLAQTRSAEATQAVFAFLQSGYLQGCDPSACGSLALETLRALATLGQAQLALQVAQATLNALREALPFLFVFAELDLVRTLSAVGRVAPELFDALVRDQSPFVRALGVAAYASVYQAEARATLLRYVSDENTLVRRAALEGLAPWATSDDTELFARFVTNSDPRTRVAALSALARAGDARALVPLRQALNAQSSSVRLDAAGAALAFAIRWSKTPSSSVP